MLELLCKLFQPGVSVGHRVPKVQFLVKTYEVVVELSEKRFVLIVSRGVNADEVLELQETAFIKVEIATVVQ